LKKEFLPCIEYSVDEVAIRTHKHKSHYRHKDCLPVTGFNPAITFLADLKSEYDDMAMFFHDVYGGQCITVVWRQSALEQESFKIGSAGGRVPVKQHGKNKTVTSLNTDAIIEDFRILGKGLVYSIEVRSK
jgi:U3 small nucleolar RNA-associated protein 22